MIIYSARHGETVWNAQRRISGRTDVELTELGRSQAQTLAENMKDKSLDLIIASPMIRAQETAKAVARVCGVPIITDERLIEQDYGIYEGVYMSAPEFQKFLENKRRFAFRYPSGESMMDVAHRVYGFFHDIKRDYDGKTILLVSHGGVSRLIHTYFYDLTNDEFYNFLPDNCEVREYEL